MPKHYKILLETMLKAFFSMAKDDDNLETSEFGAILEATTRCLSVLSDMED